MGPRSRSTNDVRLAMEYIGDRDLKQMNAYLKRRPERIDRAAQAASGALVESTPKASPDRAPDLGNKNAVVTDGEGKA